ncbi:MAG: hypothetical protein Kow00105_18680 [Phycisphaeraceae bacterium]
MKRMFSWRDQCAPAWWGSLACAVGVLSLAGRAEGLTSYHIGNSLTYDSQIVSPTGGAWKTATAAGLSWQTGWHIKCGSSLESIVSNPGVTCVDPSPVFGLYSQALPGFSFDAITLQPHSGTLQGEYVAAKQLIQSANDPGVVYLYETWPTLVEGTTLAERWHEPQSTDPSAAFVRSKAHMDWLYDTLTSDPELSGVTFRVIPAVDALIRVEEQILGGQVAGVSQTADLYRDTIHMNNLGRYVAANSVIATLFGQSTMNFPFDSVFEVAGGTGPVPLPAETQALVHDMVWQTVTSRSETGVLAGDLDEDGYIGITDLNHVLGAWGQSVAITDVADENNDGLVGIGDLNEVLGHWNLGEPGAESATVPEPGGVVVIVTGLFLACVKRGRG